MGKRWGWRSKFERRLDILKVVDKYSGRLSKRRMLNIAGSRDSHGCRVLKEFIAEKLVRIEKRGCTHYVFITFRGKWVLRVWREFQEEFGFKASSMVGDISLGLKSTLEMFKDSSIGAEELLTLLKSMKPETRKQLRYVRLGCIYKTLSRPKRVCPHAQGAGPKPDKLPES